MKIMLGGTAVWIYALFAVLLSLGLIALRSRTVDAPRPMMAPVIFILWGLAGLVLEPDVLPWLALAWLAAALAFGVLAMGLVRFDAMRLDREHRKIHMPGSVFPLICVLVIFGAKYAIGVAIALRAAPAEQLALLDVVVSGASAGLFLGWLLRFVRTYRHAASIDPLATSTIKISSQGTNP